MAAGVSEPPSGVSDDGRAAISAGVLTGGADGRGVLCGVGSGSHELVLVSREGEVVWRYDRATAGLEGWWYASEFSWDGSTIYDYSRDEDGSEGI